MRVLEVPRERATNDSGVVDTGHHKGDMYSIAE